MTSYVWDLIIANSECWSSVRGVCVCLPLQDFSQLTPANERSSNVLGSFSFKAITESTFSW